MPTRAVLASVVNPVGNASIDWVVDPLTKAYVPRGSEYNFDDASGQYVSAKPKWIPDPAGKGALVLPANPLDATIYDRVDPPGTTHTFEFDPSGVTETIERPDTPIVTLSAPKPAADAPAGLITPANIETILDTRGAPIAPTAGAPANVVPPGARTNPTLSAPQAPSTDSVVHQEWKTAQLTPSTVNVPVDVVSDGTSPDDAGSGFTPAKIALFLGIAGAGLLAYRMLKHRA